LLVPRRIKKLIFEVNIYRRLTYLISVIFILCSTGLLKSVCASERLNFTYQLTETIENKDILIYLNSYFRKNGYSPLSTYTNLNLPFLKVDQIYQKGEERIFLKLGLIPSSKNIINKVFIVARGFLFHGQLFNYVNYALYSENLSKNTFTKLSKEIAFYDGDSVRPGGVNKSTPADVFGKSRRKSNFDEASFDGLFVFIKTAYAEDLQAGVCKQYPNCDAHDKLSQEDMLRSLSTNISIGEMEQSILHSGYQCIVSALSQLQSKMEGTPAELISATKKYWNDPNLIWLDVSQKFATLSNSILSLKSQMVSLLKTLKSPDATLMGHIACMIAGDLATSLVIGGGVFSAVKFASIISNAISQLVKIKPLLNMSGRMSGSNSHLLTISEV
ncbi:MAG: hypothetical protein ABL927_14225, partial [Bdellovibrionales bacterium]